MIKIRTYTLILSCIWLLSFNAHSQKVDQEKEYTKHIQAGDKFYDAEDYFSASQEYLRAVKIKEKDGYADLRLAECYRLNQDNNDAEKWYEKCIYYYKNKFPKLYYWLALMQKTNGKYSDAQKTFSTFIKLFKAGNEEDKAMVKQANVEYKGCIFAQEQLEQPTKEINLYLLPFPVNTKNSEGAPVIFYHDSSIVITSARADGKGTELNTYTGEARTDNFRYEKKSDRWLRTDNEDNFDIVNTMADDGAGQLNQKTAKYYYTICDPECNIYVSKKVNGKFLKAEKLNTNINNGLWNGQPTITSTADTMLFVSKRDGGRGLHDIWMSINADKSGAKEDWGTARNLYAINTPGAELSPFWDPNTKILYFASNGLVGFGGVDIFRTRLYKLDSIANMGLPYNSNMDDYYFTLGKEKGYLVSNRLGGFGNGDIYSFDRYVKESVVGVMTKDGAAGAESITSIGKLFYADNQQAAPNTSVYLKDDKGVVLKEAITSVNGEFRFENLAPDKNFRIIINSSDPKIRAKVEYFVNKEGSLEGKIFYSQNQATSQAKNSTTNTTPAPQPVVAAKSEPVEPEPTPMPVKKTVVPKTEQPLPKQPKPVNQNKSRRRFFENLYYEFNSTDISPIAKITLDKLVAYLKDNKNVQVEIKAFTDGLGNTAYNIDLARQRAKACFDYLVSQNVDQTSLLMIPVGSAGSVGDNDSFTGRQLNRRVELSLTNAVVPYVTDAMIYIVEPRMTMFAIAKKFDMTVDELKSMNGIDASDLKAYMAIRVKKRGNTYISTESMENAKNGGRQELKFENSQFQPSN